MYHDTTYVQIILRGFNRTCIFGRIASPLEGKKSCRHIWGPKAPIVEIDHFEGTWSIFTCCFPLMLQTITQRSNSTMSFHPLTALDCRGPKAAHANLASTARATQAAPQSERRLRSKLGRNPSSCSNPSACCVQTNLTALHPIQSGGIAERRHAAAILRCYPIQRLWQSSLERKRCGATKRLPSKRLQSKRTAIQAAAEIDPSGGRDLLQAASGAATQALCGSDLPARPSALAADMDALRDRQQREPRSSALKRPAGVRR